ncbi:MAG TPA: ABC transporter ATP-binding protein [Waddliaceae bacterium]
MNHDSAQSSPIISAHRLGFGYQDSLVLEDVSFSVKRGEFLGIFGPNGGGKTTLLKLIMGFLEPTSGSIEVFGKPPRSSQQKISYVPQSLHFDRKFPISVFELVLSGRLAHLPWYGRYRREDRQEALHALAEVGLVDIKERAFGTLSGGQAQRALIARALVSQPELLLLDEPTASVDAQAETEIYHLLEGLKGKMTILMVTHHLRTAINQVQRVLCVKKNVISLQPEEVCEHFAIGLYHPPLIQKEV